MLDKFDFPYFVENTEYTDESRALKMGGGWEYNVEPLVADPRIFNLTFAAFVWYTKWDEKLKREVVDTDIDPDINAGRLDAFYEKHRLFRPFEFNHPKYGVVKVRFESPLSLGDPSDNSGGVVENVSLKLLEVL